MNILKQLRHWQHQRHNTHSHRQLLVLSGTESWTTAIAEALCKDESSHLWLGDRQNGEALQQAHYRQCLGSEAALVIANCHHEVRPSALFASSGIIQQQGLMVLLAPTLEYWPDLGLPPALSSFGEPDDAGSHFIRHLIQCIRQDEYVALAQESDLRLPLAPAQPAEERLDELCANLQQREAVDRIIKVATGHRHRPLVLSADRGRGKSTSLGIAAALLAADHAKRIILTAPSEQSASRALAAYHHTLKVKQQADEGGLVFIAPDKLLTDCPAADLVLVDEAAMLPTAMLKQLSNTFSRLVFSTTVHGYEGSGRGFQMRFLPFLREFRPDWRHQYLTAPIRWREGDVLESFWFNVMTMDVSTANSLAPTTAGKSIVTAHAPDISVLSGADLVGDCCTLKQVFALLLDAHYQTTPDDLMRIMDAPEQRLLIARMDGKIAGVCLLSFEGGQPLAPLAAAIASGERRVKGHLTPQSLGYLTGNKQWLSSRSARVVRIAVAPHYRLHGVGTALLSACRPLAESHQAVVISASFGASAQLINFWQANQFVAIKLGTKQDAASGEHSMLVIKPLNNTDSAASAANIEQLRLRHIQKLLFDLPRSLTELSPELATRLVAEAKVGIQDHGKQELGSSEQLRLAQFVDGTRALDSCAETIYRLLTEILSPQAMISHEGSSLLMAKIVMGWRDQPLCQYFGLSGRKEVHKRLRLSLKTILSETKLE